MSDDWKVGESRMFYPHYCLVCHTDYVAATRLEPCRWCGATNVLNCAGETINVAIQKEKLSEA